MRHLTPRCALGVSARLHGGPANRGGGNSPADEAMAGSFKIRS